MSARPADSFSPVPQGGGVRWFCGGCCSAPGSRSGAKPPAVSDPRPVLDILPDILAPGLNLVVCGSAAGTRSAELGAYYAGPGNQFWGMLHRVGLTPRVLKPAEFREVIAYAIGLTDIAK